MKTPDALGAQGGMEKCDRPQVPAEKAAKSSSTPPPPGAKCGLGTRHFQCSLLFGCFLIAYLQRLNLSVAVVQMVTSEENRVEMGAGEKALVMSSFFWGYGLLQMPLGALGRRGHAVLLLALGNICSGFLSLLLPLLATTLGPLGICALRFFTGIVQGTIFPNSYNLMSKWIVPQEKEALASIIYSGAMLGALTATVMSGYLGYHYDWPSIFYVSGLLGILWGIYHYFLGAESHQTCRYMSPEERHYMELSFREEGGARGGVPSKVPWKKIFSSGPVLAAVAAMFANSWGGWTLATLTPSFISGVLHFDLEDDGLLSALPQLSSFIFGLSLSFIGTVVKRKSGLPDSFLRLFWNSISQYGSCLGLLCLAVLPAGAGLAVSLLVVCVSINVLATLGHQLSPLELSHHFAGVLMSFANSVANLASIAGPLLSTYLVQDTGDRTEWRVVFLIAAAIYFIGGTVFLFWGSTKRQHWDRVEGEAPQGPA